MFTLLRYGLHLVRAKLRDRGLKKRSPRWSEVEAAFLKCYACCAACGADKRLQVHHKKPFHLYPDLELDPNNLVTLCMTLGRECHLAIGHGGDFKAYNPNVEGDIERAKDPKEFLLVVAAARAARIYE